MPVISPRRSSTSGSSSLYGTTSSTTGTSSGIGSSSYSSGSSYLDRASSLSKTTSSNYSPSYNYLSSYSTYTPRIPAYRSSSSSSSYLSGGSSTLGTYRPTSTYLSSNDSTSSSRYGLNRKPKSSDSVKNDKDTNTISNTKKSDRRPPSGSDSKRLSGSYSSSSLARYVATSGLDLYEKYSPAHYKPNCELSCSRSSITDAVANDDIVNSNNTSNNKNSTMTTTTTVTLDRPRSRYSRLYDDIGSKYDTDSVDNASINNYKRNSYRGSGKLVNSSSASSIGISASNSSGDIPSATFTLRVNNLSKTRDSLGDTENDSNVVVKNGINDAASLNGIDHLKELKLTDADAQRSDSNNNDTSQLSNNNKTKLLNNHSNTNNNNNNNDDYNLNNDGNNSIGDVHGNFDDGSVSTTATIRLDTQSPKSSKVRSSSYRSTLPPPSPTTSSRYWDRDNVRTSSTLSTSGNSTYNSTSNDADTSKSSDEKSEGLCGLRNIGNTCFMNSVIQCLSHTSELTKFLRTHNPVRSTSNKDQQILNEYSKLIRDMWTNNIRSVTPMDLKRAFSLKHRMYSDYSQQDAQEFLRFFLDALHCALNSGVKGEHLKIDDNLSDNKKADLTWEWYTRHENSLIRDLFVGQLKSTLRCTTCGNTSVTFDPFWDLSVPLPSTSRCKLDACLDLFIREENLDGDEMPTCSRCKTRRKCTKSFTIQRFPKILVIHLKRFSETRWSKLSNIVEFPTGERDLNMGPYGSNPNTNMYYSLYAISNHMGSTAGGHYVALCKHPISRKWHEFNDNIVSDTLSENHLVSSSAYILFYERA